MKMNYPGDKEQKKMFRSKKEYEALEEIQVVQPRSGWVLLWFKAT